MRQFVIPGIHALARADGKILLDEHIKPSDRIVRPSSKCTYAEAGMLLAVCSSILKKTNPTREIALGLCREVGKPGDAKFVYELDLGGRGLADRVKNLSLGYDGVEGADVLHSFISNSVKELKRRTRKQSTAIYPGRDVWCWEVMSQRQGMPSHYDSKVSRSIAINEKAMAKVVQSWQIPDWEKTVLFDTGHAGTVPRAIGKAAGLDKMNVIMLSAADNDLQLFKTHAKSRKKALACEYLAKYRRRAVVQNDEPYQEIADLEEFIKAALLTIWLWYHVSPGRLPSWRDEEVKPKKGGLTYTPSGSGSGGISINNNNPPLFINPSSSSSNLFWDTGTSITGGGTNILDWGTTTAASNWNVTTAATTLDSMWGQGASASAFVDIIDQQKQQIGYLKDKYQQAVMYPKTPLIHAINPKTFNLIDPVSKTPLEPAMDAKALGLDPVQYEIQRARKEALDNAKSRLASLSKPIDKSLTTKVAVHAPPYGPPGVQHTITLDKNSGQALRNTIVSQALPGSLQANPPSQSSLPPSGSVIGTTPTPTTRKGRLTVVPIPPLPLVTDGKGKPITG